MKHLLLLVFLFPLITFSQCPPDGTFNSQAEIDAFAIDYPNCTTFGLWIEGNDITDLSGLYQITNSGAFKIINNPLLEDLDGLNPDLTVAVSYMNNIEITNNAALTDISALETASLSTDGPSSLLVTDNPLLSSLVGLNLISSQYIYIGNNDALTSLNGLHISYADYVSIGNNDNIIDLTGLIIDYTGGLEIVGHASLQSLNGAIVVVGWDGLYIANNPSLTGFGDFFDNTVLDLYFPYLDIINNENLSTCSVTGLCDFFDHINTWDPDEGYYASINIEDNAPGCNSRAEVEFNCGLVPGNDECDRARLIEIGETLISYNELATESPQIPSCNDVNRADVWFVFNTGSYSSIDIIASAGYNLQLWEYEGGACPVTHVVNACGNEVLLDVPVSSSSTYVLQVWSDTNKRPTGWFNILVQDGLLSTPEFELDAISIYPNPAQNELHIQSNTRIDTIQMFNLLGQQVLESKETTLDVSNLTEGLYVVKVMSSGKETTYKIVKE